MNIVVVEDAKPIREGLANILHRIDSTYQVAGKAADGVEGLKLIKEIKPDLVIMDIQMPDMDGLTMLEKVREEKIDCKVIVLTAYSDFNYAKKAIELGIENYLLKPIKIAELKKALHQVEESLDKERFQEQIYSLEYVFKSSLTGALAEDDILEEILKDKYGFNAADPVEMLLVWLDGIYEESCQAAVHLLENVGSNTQKFDSVVMTLEDKKAVAVIIYKKRTDDGLENYFRQSVFPMLVSNLGSRIVGVWGECEGLGGLRDLLKEMMEELEWNLLLPAGTLISRNLIDGLSPVPFKFPMDLENKIRRAAANRDMEEYKQCLAVLNSACTREVYEPKDIKDGFIRFFMTLAHAAKEYGGQGEGGFSQKLLMRLSASNTWKEIADTLTEFFELNFLTDQEKSGEADEVSPLVQKARLLIQEYYSQGITLEETARKLHVSDEYLSTQFKKETGKSFTETIRAYRIEKIKKLLLESDLKLAQIAAMTGYSDPKYMSKVFRDEVGVLPAEYRKREI
ncbi:DNA-binding response regulator [Clostridium sp. chh4-2]|uniref:response regulator transcription factor n=1 Tax=Clostridium sp. chh4-2 TaxID=2067550 RepID=UPI000CCF0C13|nr:response regulator [Clostridium sp. chh4-2]PNV59396.1 DNA-binding response regulator [Clostridium sp. chh4-2]